MITVARHPLQFPFFIHLIQKIHFMWLSTLKQGATLDSLICLGIISPSLDDYTAPNQKLQSK